ncbi:MAG: peptidase S8 [Bacillota bacterium]|nr:peptidase S8 [Bacillota bacterium]
MARKLLLLLLIFSAFLMVAGCSLFNKDNVEENNKNIYAHPKPFNMDRGKLSSLPDYDKYSNDIFQVDLRSYDLTALDLNNKFDQLIHSDFDTKTKWPFILPENFSPKKVIEYGKNPGLGINKLHNDGIDGRGVNVAIIGPPILVEHVEYKKQLKLYKELGFASSNASPEGTAAASILAGNSTGVSPGVGLYYVAIKSGGEGSNSYSTKDAIDWIVKFNENLPKGQKIRAICIQEKIIEDNKNDEPYTNIIASMKKATDRDIFVISTISDKLYNTEICFKGLGRDALTDPDTPSSYLPGKSWAISFYEYGRYKTSPNMLFVPSDSRCVASPTGIKDYAFYTNNDWNFYLFYAAGLYALTCQVKPTITPEEFIEKAVETSSKVEIINNNLKVKYKLENVASPIKLIQKLRND